MLTKIGVAALLGTMGTAAVGGTASAHENRYERPVSVTVAAPAPIPVAYGYGTPGVYYRHDRRDDFRRGERERMERERMERQRMERAREHAEWLRHHGGWGVGRR